MPDEDLYGDAEASASFGESVTASGDEANTALIPSQLCPGMQPGERISLTIERVLDGQYEVSYEKDKPTKEPEPPGDDTGMDEMMT